MCINVLLSTSIFSFCTFFSKAQKELLDAELDFHKRLSSGEDTTELRKKLNQLQVEVSMSGFMLLVCFVYTSLNSFQSFTLHLPFFSSFLTGCPFRHFACRPRKDGSSPRERTRTGPWWERKGSVKSYGGRPSSQSTDSWRIH